MIKFLCHKILVAQGWRFEVNLPKELRSFVFVGAPHTSNFDFFPAMVMSKIMNRNARFVIKSEWLRFPFNLVMKPLGAIGVDRSLLQQGIPQSNTDRMAHLFKQYPELVLMISPEGTRKPNSHWKTGFYYVAQKAQVPIVLAHADYKKKLVTTGPIIFPKDFESDMRTITNYFREVQGRNPQNFLLDPRFKAD
jgi:1-acyl-sn-glycerol-3-phosphate acyltransferase